MFYRPLFTLLAGLLLTLGSTGAAAKSPQPQSDWWNIPYISKLDPKLTPVKQQQISVNKNRLVDESGKTVVFRGMNTSDPDKLVNDGRWSKQYFQEAKNWGANILRIPVHPISWRNHGRQSYLKLLDQAVIWANELDMYLIIDWHSIGNLHDGVYQHPIYDTTMQETKQFWQVIASRYSGVATVAFYEIFNEPTVAGGGFGKMTWSQWKHINEDIIDLIRNYDSETIPLVGGFNWAYDLRGAKSNMIGRKGIAYVSHPYPQKVKDGKYLKGWHSAFGFMAKRAPLIATEIGWMHDGERGAHIPVINNDDSYGPMIVDYLDSIGASWVAWVFDPDWTPNMFETWNYTPTTQGKYFKQEMLKRNTPINK